ncbi:hypothetical protein BBJ28_00015069 [Nothophytophthora sp. Chile5]|nr:hypothetical protein BBJ28_00015069 [Nothophytophthora sp. Chile5]
MTRRIFFSNSSKGSSGGDVLGNSGDPGDPGKAGKAGKAGEPLPPRRWPPSRLNDSRYEDDDRGLNDSTATVIPILSRVDNPLESSCAVLETADYDAALMSSSRLKERANGRVASSMDPATAGPGRSVDDSIPEKHAVELVTRRHLGLLVSTLFAGVFTTCLKRGLLPLVQGELEMETYQADAADVLMLLPWSYSFVWGFISDAVPVLGSRRKAYIVMAWTLSLVSCFGMAVLNYALEYNALSSEKAAEEALEHRVALIDAYVLLLMLASFGSILALVVGETYVIAQTRREPLEERGRALGTLLLTQFVGECVGQIAADKAIFHITAFGLTPLYSFRQTALFFMFYSLIPLLALFFFFHEDADPPAIDDGGNGHFGPRFPSGLDDQEALETRSNWFERFKLKFQRHWGQLRSALAKESTTRAVRFFMIFVFLSEFTLTYPHDRLEEWCGMTDKADSSGKITMEAFYVLAVAAWKYCGLNVDWRRSISASFLLTMILPQVAYFFMATLEAGTRSIEAFTFITALRGFLRAALVVLEVSIAAEIAPVGGEGAFVGVVVSIGSIMRLLATTSSNALGYMFDDVGSYGSSSRDDQDRGQVAFALGVCYAIRLIALVALIFLPKQKRALQRLHRHGAQGDRRTAWWVLGMLGCAFLISLVFNMLAISPSTSCLRLVGGAGCS